MTRVFIVAIKKAGQISRRLHRSPRNCVDRSNMPEAGQRPVTLVEVEREELNLHNWKRLTGEGRVGFYNCNNCSVSEVAESLGLSPVFPQHETGWGEPKARRLFKDDEGRWFLLAINDPGTTSGMKKPLTEREWGKSSLYEKIKIENSEDLERLHDSSDTIFIHAEGPLKGPTE